jgi:O-antigen/teichoic acid export membrane protein
MIEFGMNDSLLRFFVAKLDHKEEMREFLARMLVLYAVIGSLIFTSGIIISEICHLMFMKSMTEDQIVLLENIIAIMSLGAAISIFLNPVGALIYAHERFVFIRIADLTISVATTGCIVIGLVLGYGLFMVVIFTVLGQIIRALANVIYCLARINIPIRIEKPNSDEIKSTASYAAPIFISVITEQIFWKLDQIFVGVMISAAAVAVYSIGITFNKYFMAFGTAISRTLTPDIIRTVDSGADPGELTDLMIRISRLQALGLLLVLGGLIVFGQRFLILWLGENFSESYFVMLAVLCPYTLELTGNARNIVLQVKGLYWQRSLITAAMAVLNIPLTIWLLKIWGVTGGAIATGVAVLSGYVLIAVLLHRRVGLSMWRYWRETSRRILPLFVCLVVIGLALQPVMLPGWAGLLIGSCLFGAIYVAGVLIYAANGYERAIVRRILLRSVALLGLRWNQHRSAP